jgi:hypothetical protein
MIELFRTLSKDALGVLRPPAWAFVQRGLQRNVSLIQQHHYAYPRAVRSTHVLIRLLSAIAVPRALSLERYYAHVDAIALNAAMVLRMTSSISRGSLFRGMFYGTTTPEILIATDDRFDFEHVHAHWRTTQALTPLLHAKSDLNAFLPNGADTSKEDGLAVILVNVPMLAVQYRAFLLSQEGRESPQTVMQFIGGYVLPNMLPRHLDLCLFNRVARLLLDRPTAPPATARHSFALTNYERAADACLVQALDNVQRSSLNFRAILSALPALYAPSQYEVLQLPDTAPTRQVDWALVLCRLKAVDFVFTAADEQLQAKNQMSINQMARALSINDTQASLRENLPAELFFDAQSTVQRILSQVA